VDFVILKIPVCRGLNRRKLDVFRFAVASTLIP